jgi:ADP-ribose pyrophosphatase YjhB (NUDIX family)
MPISRQYPPCPLVGVGVFVLRGDLCLIARRGHEPSYGAWSVPGGRVELGESLREAALRELAEECGPDLRVDLKGIGAALDRISVDGEGRTSYHFVLLDFVAEHVSGEPTAGSDALEVRWAPVDEVAGLHTTEGLARYYAEFQRRRSLGILSECLALEGA